MKINATVEIMEMTPEMASEYLANRWPTQRPIRNNRVSRMASDMIAGRFRLGPDSVLRIKGKLANGQHRLSAVVQSGKPQMFIVLNSNDEELYKIVDFGMKRTISDTLAMRYAKSVPGIARWVRAYESKAARPGARGAQEASVDAELAPTETEMIDYCLDNEEILIEAAQFVSPLYHQTRLLAPSIAGAMYVIASCSDSKLEKTKQFLTEVYVGGVPSSAMDLRNRMTLNNQTRMKSKLLPGYIFGISLKALKSYLNGTRPGVLKWSKQEGLPEI